MRRMMAEKVSMMGTPATMSGMMSEVSAAVRDTLSSEMEPSANPSSSEPESPRKILGGVEIVAKEGDARADKRSGDGGGVAASR